MQLQKKWNLIQCSQAVKKVCGPKTHNKKDGEAQKW